MYKLKVDIHCYIRNYLIWFLHRLIFIAQFTNLRIDWHPLSTCTHIVHIMSGRISINAQEKYLTVQWPRCGAKQLHITFVKENDITKIKWTNKCKKLQAIFPHPSSGGSYYYTSTNNSTSL